MTMRVKMTELQYNEVIESLKQVMEFELAKVRALESDEDRKQETVEHKNRRNVLGAAICNLIDAHMRMYNRNYDASKAVCEWAANSKEHTEKRMNDDYYRGLVNGYELAKKDVRDMINDGGEQ